jgi:hypothetical protein
VAEEAIRELWAWFADRAQFLARNMMNEAMHAELDARVSALGPLVWEIGPGLVKPNAFVVSPDGDADLLALTTQIIEAAPPLADWEWHAARPPKQRWNLTFDLRADGTSRSVDASRWRYVLYDFGDEVFELTVYALFTEDLADKLREAAVEIVLQGVLGERRRMSNIGRYDVKVTLDPEQEAVAITSLAQHLDDVLRQIAPCQPAGD